MTTNEEIELHQMYYRELANITDNFKTELTKMYSGKRFYIGNTIATIKYIYTQGSSTMLHASYEYELGMSGNLPFNLLKTARFVDE